MCPSNPALSFKLKVVKTGPDTFSWKYRELHKNSCLYQIDVFKATVEQHVGDSNATESDSMLVRANACTEKLVNFLLILLQWCRSKTLSFPKEVVSKTNLILLEVKCICKWKFNVIQFVKMCHYLIQSKNRVFLLIDISRSKSKTTCIYFNIF